MKIIDLLNKIANGEEVPKRIKVNNFVYEYIGFMYCTENSNFKDIADYIFGKWNFNILNNEVEILDDEEKGLPEKLEKIDSLFEIGQDLDLKGFLAWQKANNKMIKNKINEIIDYLEKQRGMRMNEISLLDEVINRLQLALKCMDSELQCVFEAYEIEDILNKLITIKQLNDFESKGDDEC